MKYIDRVLSKLKGYKGTKEIEYELFDHLDENEKFFIDIGYDNTLAEEKAEERMGDAEILAEQFKEVELNKSGNLPLAIVNVLILILIPIFFMSIIYPTSYFGHLDSFAIIPTFITFILFSFDVLLSMKSRSIAGIIVSLIAGGFICFGYTGSSSNATTVLNNQSSARLFFEYGYFVFISLIVIFAIAQLSTIIIKIKTAFQRNRKFDLKLMKAMKIIVSVASVITIVSISNFLPILTININEVRSELNDANQTAIQSIDSLIGCDYEGAKAWVENTFPDYHFENEETIEYDSYPKNFSEETCTFYSPNSHISIYLTSYENGTGLHIRNECEFFASDPDYDLNFFKAEDLSYIKNAAKNKTNAKDMNLPYGITIFDFDKPNKTDIQVYYSVNHCDEYILTFERNENELIATNVDHLML